MSTRKRSRSPRRMDRRSNVRRRYVPLQYNYPKFDDSPKQNESNAINQLTTDALYKQVKRSARPRIIYDSDSRKGSAYKSKSYIDNFNSKNRPDSVRKYKNDSPLRKNDKPAYKNDDIFNAPRSGYYFEHDNRQFDKDRNHHRRNSYGVSRRMVERSPNSNRASSRKYNNGDRDKLQTGNINQIENSHSKYKEKDRIGGFWQHDKFEEVEKDGNNNKS